MREIISCIIGLALIFTSVFPGNLIDYKINTETQGNKVMINEELLYGGKDIEELKLILPTNYTNLLINDIEYTNLKSAEMNMLNEISYEYNEDSINIIERKEMLNSCLTNIEHPRENKYISFFKSVILSPSVWFYATFTVVDIGFLLRDKFILGTYNYNSYDFKMLLYFGVLAAYSIVKVIIHEVLKNRINYSTINNEDDSYRGNPNKSSLLKQYFLGNDEALAYIKKTSTEGIKYNSLQNKYCIMMGINYYGLSSLFPLVGYYFPNILSIASQDPSNDWLLFLLTPIFLSVLDVLFFSTYSISYMIQMNNNSKLYILQAHKIISEREKYNRAFNYGYYQVINKWGE